MGTLIGPAPLDQGHDLETFDCGDAALNDWLIRRARAAAASGTARTYVVADGATAVAYYCLAAGAVLRDAAPKPLRRNAPTELPVILIGRLAVHTARQGQGMGHGLLKDAVSRSLAVADTVGVRGILVHAINDDAVRFYAGAGFLPSPLAARTLFLPMETARAALNR